MTSYLDPKLDVVFKLFFGSEEGKVFLISLLTAVLKPKSKIIDAEVLDPEIPKELVDDKGIVLDLLVRLEDGSLIDVEMQVDRRPGFRKRSLYYLSRMYGSQIIRGNLYVDLKPVVLIVILNYKELRANRLHSVFHVTEDHDGQVFQKDLEIHLIELPKLKSRKAIRGVRKDLLRWSRFFAAKTAKELEKAVKGDEVMEKAKSYLEMLSQDPSAQEIARLREMGRVSYILDINAAKAEGFNEGLAEGETKGEAKGQNEMLIRVVTRKFGELTEEQQKMLEVLDHDILLERIFTAKTFDDLLDS